MSQIDYTIFYKKRYDVIDDLKKEQYDLLISSFNSSERVQKVFDQTNATRKVWLVQHEYGYSSKDYPNQEFFNSSEGQDEDEIIRSFIDSLKIDFNTTRICVDITGFIRPHLIFLVLYLNVQGADKVDFVYADPISYKNKENTIFSEKYIEVRQVAGYEGSHNPEVSNDFLIMSSGYDSKRITDVAKNKAKAKKVQVFGFPSLQPDMYQENILKAYLAEEDSSDRQIFIDPDFTLFAPANDPFVTASSLQAFVKQQSYKSKITNLYLAPMATKAQTLGFAIFYIAECLNEPVSMIFPFCENYAKETTEGVSKVWKYTVEFKALLQPTGQVSAYFLH